MSAILYTALRRIEKIAYLKTGNDISAAASDDSFNSATLNLSGLLDNQWIKVSGFANAANNGWFQANGNSTSAKITQDTSTVLVTEAIGPAVMIQGYKRGSGEQYSLEFTPRKLDASTPEITRDQQQALNGSTETLLHRIETFWDVVTGRILEADVPQWEEFIASVAAGETFTFDPYGTIAAPDNPLTCDLVSTSHQRSRIGNIRRYTIPFKVRVIE